MPSLLKKISAYLFLFFLFFPLLTTAQEGGIGSAFTNAKEVADKSGYNYDKTFNNLASDIIQLALSVLGTLFVVFIIYAGFLWLTAAGNDQRVEKAKKIIFESIIGLVIVIAAYAITYFIVSAFKGQINF